MKRLNRCFRSITTAGVARTKAQAPSFSDTCAACATVCIFPAAANCRVLAPLLTDPPLLPVESGPGRSSRARLPGRFDDPSTFFCSWVRFTATARAGRMGDTCGKPQILPADRPPSAFHDHFRPLFGPTPRASLSHKRDPPPLL